MVISQLDTPSRRVSRCWSICHSAYDDRAAPAAFPCSGPTEPFLASSCDLQMHVARLRSSALGAPNQYLSSAQVSAGLARNRGIETKEQQDERWDTWGAGCLLEEATAGHCFGMRRPVESSEIRIHRCRENLRPERHDIKGRLLEFVLPGQCQFSHSVHNLVPVE